MNIPNKGIIISAISNNLKEMFYSGEKKELILISKTNNKEIFNGNIAIELLNNLL